APSAPAQSAGFWAGKPGVMRKGSIVVWSRTRMSMPRMSAIAPDCFGVTDRIRTGPRAISRIVDPSVILLFGATEPCQPYGPGGISNAPDRCADPACVHAVVASSSVSIHTARILPARALIYFSAALKVTRRNLVMLFIALLGPEDKWRGRC